MDGHNVILPPISTNISNETNVMVIGIGYSRELLEKWNSSRSPLHKVIVNHNPLAVGIVPALNDFVRLD